MPRNVDKKYGNLKRSPPSLGPLLCTVYSNYDPTRQGLLQVYASDSLDTNTNNPQTYKVRRLSPYFGQTIGGGADDDWGSYTSNPSSYGQWQSPPDIGTEVINVVKPYKPSVSDAFKIKENPFFDEHILVLIQLGKPLFLCRLNYPLIKVYQKISLY